MARMMDRLKTIGIHCVGVVVLTIVVAAGLLVHVLFFSNQDNYEGIDLS